MEKENILKIAGSEEELRISSHIEYTYLNNGDTLELYVKYPTKNMQDDEADFEAIVFAIWSVNPELKIVLKYNHLDWGNKFPLPTYVGKNSRQYVKSDIQHYMRFLYRAYKMKMLYENFSINFQNDAEVSLFERLIEDAKGCNNLCMTVPDSKSKVKNKKEPTENHLEKWFVLQSREESDKHSEVQSLRKETGVCELYDQFPCGLFYSNVEPSEENRIFNTGYFDLWGLDENNDVCLFELKKIGNNQLGIISELFFYSCLVNDFKYIVKLKERKKVRGYNIFARAIKNAKIKAYFLVPEFHSFIEKNIDNIIKVMNQRKDDVEYGYVRFNYDNIVDDTSFKNLCVEWKKFKY